MSGKDKNGKNQDDDYYLNTFQAIGDELGITQAGALYIYNKALNKIRHAIKCGKIQNYKSFVE